MPGQGKWDNMVVVMMQGVAIKNKVNSWINPSRVKQAGIFYLSYDKTEKMKHKSGILALVLIFFISHFQRGLKKGFS